MNFYFYQHSIFDAVQIFVSQFGHLLQYTREIGEEFSDCINPWKSRVRVTTLQWSLFKLLCILVILTSLLIVYSWKVYGKVITDKFVRPSTLKEIEELKLSVAKLKLPKEHSPRI